MTVSILNKIFNNVPEINIDDKSKFVFISDCHRGDGTWKDDLLPNLNIYIAALKYYYKRDFTQIEIGDGDELWKVSKIGTIYDIYPEVFNILLKFKRKDRFYMIVGNHDEIKHSRKFRREIEKYKFDNSRKDLYDLFHELTMYEGLKLVYKPNCTKLFIIHGHQVDFINYQLGKVACFLVRYIWSTMEQVFGFRNPTSPAKNHSKRTKVDKRLEKWVVENNQPMIAGHTHRSILSVEKNLKYFNDGCCVYPYSITCIELEKGELKLIKWQTTSLENGVLCVRRDIIGGPVKIELL